MKVPQHHVIIVPGLGNHFNQHVKITKGWNKQGIIPHVFNAKWQIEEKGLEPKLEVALKLVDSLVKKGNKVSLMGNSAGSSFVLNIFARRKSKIHRVIINCGRIRRGDWPWFSFAQATAKSPSFKQAVLRAEQLERSFSSSDRQKIITIRPLFDELVPSYTVPIKGARNMLLPSIEHMLSITLVMLFPFFVVRLLKDN